MAQFSTDQDILQWEPDLVVYLPESQADYTPQHIAAADAILEDLRKRRIIRPTETTDGAEQILRPAELKEAAKFKSLEIIFTFLSANATDKFKEKSIEYRTRYIDEIANVVNTLTVDVDRDGIEDKGEIGRSFQTILRRN